MEKATRFIISTLFSILILNSPSSAVKYPAIEFQVSGKIIDWDTKKPLENANLIIFLNDAVYADNNGWVKDAQDFPNFPKSNQNGNFNGRTRLYRDRSKIKIERVEIIAFREGYRTERFFIKGIKFSLSPDNLSGTLEIEPIELLKNRIE